MTTGGLLDILGTFLEVPGVDVTNETIALNLEVCMRVCARLCMYYCGVMCVCACVMVMCVTVYGCVWW